MGKRGELPRTCTIHYVASALPDTRPWGGPKAEIKHSIASKTLSATKGRHPIAQIAQIAAVEDGGERRQGGFDHICGARPATPRALTDSFENLQR